MGRLNRAASGVVTAALLLLAACASPPAHGPIHFVRPGENLYRIALHYGVEVSDIRRANRIRDVTELSVGQRLVIPGGRTGQPSGALTPPDAARRPAPRIDRELARRESDLDLRWPVSGRISSGFGWRRGRRHEGIDIPSKRGTPVRAAEAGRVIHSGRLGAYGNVVIIKHAGRYSTVYAHNRRNKVHRGDFVERGDVIATVGKSGNASGSHLHFEVRRNRIAQDPLRFLPDLSRTARR